MVAEATALAGATLEAVDKAEALLPTTKENSQDKPSP